MAKITYIGTPHTYHQNGETFIEIPKVSLDDDCKNGIYELHFGVDVKRKAKNGHRYDYGFHHSAEHFGELAVFGRLDGCNVHGYHTYVYANAQYHISRGDLSATQSLLRATDKEMLTLRWCCDKEDVRYWCWKLGLVDRWQREMRQAILYLEVLSGKKWINPYTQERFVEPVTPLDVATWCEQERTGYFSVVSMSQRRTVMEQQKKIKLLEEQLHSLGNLFREEITKSFIKIQLIEFDIDNAIYYSHSNTLSFNWKDYGDQVTKEQFDYFVEHCDKSKLPADIKFELKQNKQVVGIAILKNGQVELIKA